MSYSFSVISDTKEDLKVQLAAEFQKVVTSQPVHEIDMVRARQAAQAFVDMLGDLGANQEYAASVSGSVGWKGKQEDQVFTSANLSVSTAIRTKAA